MLLRFLQYREINLILKLKNDLRCCEDRLMMLSRKVFCGATRPLRPAGILRPQLRRKIYFRFELSFTSGFARASTQRQRQQADPFGDWDERGCRCCCRCRESTIAQKDFSLLFFVFFSMNKSFFRQTKLRDGL